MKRLLFLLVFAVISCSKNNSVDDSKDKIVGIIPYEEISNEEVVVLSKTIEDFYGVKTILLHNKKLPIAAFVNIKSARYRADSIIKIQNRNCPDSLDFVLGLTTKDVSVTKKDKDGNILKPMWKYNDFGVMGLAYCPGKSSIISKFRLKSSNKKLELERFKKVVIHEFGHNLGLPHCVNTNCVMTSAAEKISTIDKEKMELCDKCKKQIM
ncbi:zinc-dependent metalloprotease family protein [Flavobacterium macrobrachii]|uniref:zinc-dependent metalloprotease family protein n=1 Tax=Flavobacterium macrobrachii TaxID=591204 RepID=UPI003F7259EE